MHPKTPAGERTTVIVICPRLLDVLPWNHETDPEKDPERRPAGSLFAAWIGGFFDGREGTIYMDSKQRSCIYCLGDIY
jgi:hypothetical protein